MNMIILQKGSTKVGHIIWDTQYGSLYYRKMVGLALRWQQPGLGAHLHQDFKHCIHLNKDNLPLKTAQN